MRCSLSISLSTYDECVKNGGELAFTCDGCSFSSLPFSNHCSIENDVTHTISSSSSSSSSSPSPASSSSFSFPAILSSKGVHFIHANVRSLLPKLPEIRLFLARTKATVFAASETWLDATVNDNELQIPGFNVIRRDRNRNGGGVALFIRDNIAFNPRPDLAVDGLEATWVELLPPKTKGILVCSMYRPPNDGNFLTNLESALSKVDPGTELYILGDTNINSTETGSILFGKYKEVLDSFGLDQLIKEPTRITPSTSSVIDHVLTNASELIQSSGVIGGGFSDHFLTFCSRRCIKGISYGHNIKKVRSFKNYSKLSFIMELRKIDWSSVLTSVDVDYCLSEFSRLFKSAIDVVAPYREIRIRSKPNQWMNSEILAAIRKRNDLLSRYKRNRSNEVLFKEYCKVRNAVQRDIRLAKENFFKQGVEKNKGDSGKLWNHLKSLGYSKKTSFSSSNIVLEDKGCKVFNRSAVARLFNIFYTSVASDLVTKLPNPYGMFCTSSRIFKDYYHRIIGTKPSFVLSPVTSHFIRKQLSSLDPRKAIGLDDVASRFLHDGAESIVLPVTHIINLSISNETVPAAFKDAKVVPVFKKGSKLDVGNYRPVSILNVLSKVLERTVHKQMDEYLKKRNLLFSHQSGFRGGYSTDTCLVDMSNYVRSEMGKGNMVGMVLIDLQKAFDTVDHDILIDKLRAIGVSSVSWFRSYLSDRKQCVEVNGTRSEFLPINCGVPQGSILGPQLFLIYVNDMVTSVDCRLSLYADDSALLFAHSDPNVIASRLSTELSNCKRWLVDNKLSLHIGKTECMLFGTKRKLKGVRDFRIDCDGTLVERVSSVKYLGVQLDGSLSGAEHVGDVLKTCTGRLSFLYRNKAFLDFNCRRILCASLIQPYIDYCCSAWYGGLSVSLKNRLDVTQRKMVRFVNGMDLREHVGKVELLRLSWLSIPDRVTYFRLIHLFKVWHRTAPSYLVDSFTPVSVIHSHNTRGSSHNFQMSRDLGNVRNGFTFLASKEWNALPDELKLISELRVFKKRLKEYLFSRYA